MVQFIKAKVPTRIDMLANYIGNSGETSAGCVTHQFCNQSALAIMECGGNKEEAELIRPFLAQINEGIVWADGGYRNITHFFNPLTQKGLWNLPSAAAGFRQFIRQAIKYGQKANLAKAMFYTGAAVHLLQDICVPHHSCNLLFSGHAEYEHWVEGKLDDYPLLPENKRLAVGENFMNMFFKNALLSTEYIDFVAERATEREYKIATAILLPLAQYSTAKMFVWIVKNLVWIPQTAEHNRVAL
ncbi:MAG: zinc dependent phospholipase C family protein [Negativicutes bacterium]|nr:zinc dependent phospholipase C family protein [Negativicutes bacterium]